jgi:hypothetical protein
MPNVSNLFLIGLIMAVVPMNHIVVHAMMGHPIKEIVSVQDHKSNSIRSGSIHRSTVGTDLQKMLQTKLVNWELCTNANFVETFTPMNDLVPKDTIFLSTYFPDIPSIKRTGTIQIGVQTIFFPIDNVVYIDYEDDWEAGICPVKSKNETLRARLHLANETNSVLKMIEKDIHVSVDGTPIQPFYVYNTDTIYMEACPGDVSKTTEESYMASGFPEGDTCDMDPFQIINGLDAFPILGWYGIDVHEWKIGDTRTYTIASPFRGNVTYVLTAVDDTAAKKCGILGFGFFCIINWFQILFDMFK